MSAALWFFIGSSAGASAMALFMNHRFAKVLVMIEGEVDRLNAYHDEIVRGLISRVADNDGGKHDPLS
jgi:hypothetical protein